MWPGTPASASLRGVRMRRPSPSPRRPPGGLAAVLGILAASGLDARPAGAAPPERVAEPGVTIAADRPLRAGDPLLRRLAAAFVAAGHEAQLAVDLARPDALGAEVRARALRALEAGRAGVEAGALADAGKALELAVTELAERASSAEDLARLAEALRARGRLALASGDSAAAEADLVRAAALAPRAPLDDLGAPAAELYRAVAAVAARRSPGRVLIEAGPLPAAARVSVDFGAPLGLPARLELSPGEHWLGVEAEGRAPVIARVAVIGGRDQAFFVRPPLPGSGPGRSRAYEGFRAEQATTRARLLDEAATAALLVVGFEGRDARVEVFGPDGLALAEAGGVIPVAATDEALIELARRVIDAAGLEARARARRPVETAWYAEWWFITLLGVAVAGGATAAAVVLSRPDGADFVFRP